MRPTPSQPPWEFLLTASRNSLQSYELSRLAHCSDLRKELAALLEQWVEENSAAMLARWLLEQRDRAARAPEALSRENSSASRPHPVSDNVFADRGVSTPPNAGSV